MLKHKQKLKLARRLMTPKEIKDHIPPFNTPAWHAHCKAQQPKKKKKREKNPFVSDKLEQLLPTDDLVSTFYKEKEKLEKEELPVRWCSKCNNIYHKCICNQPKKKVSWLKRIMRTISG